MLYSPASMRTQWMLDWQTKGDSWARNGTESAGDDNATDIFGKLVTHLGLQGQIISSAMVAQGALQRGGWRVLILPNAIALSSKEADEIRHFVARGGTVIADAEPGLYDQHSRRLAKPLLADVFRPKAGADATVAFGKGHAAYVEIYNPTAGAGALTLRDLRPALLRAQIHWPLTITDLAGRSVSDVEVHFFQNGEAMIVALQRDPPVSSQSTGIAAVSAQMVSISLPQKSFVYDVRAKKALGNTDHLVLALDPHEPMLLALSKTPLPSFVVTAPERARQGDATELHFAFPGPVETAPHTPLLFPFPSEYPPKNPKLFSPQGPAPKSFSFLSPPKKQNGPVPSPVFLTGKPKSPSWNPPQIQPAKPPARRKTKSGIFFSKATGAVIFCISRERPI